MRALSTVASFSDVARKHPDLIRTLVGLGLNRLGFGIDGATSAVWFKTKKPLRSDLVSIEVIRQCRQDFGITPEVLMVFGHNDADDARSLSLAVGFMENMHDTYDAIPRPHVAKDVVPGNNGWHSPLKHTTVEFLTQNPEAFQLLDFTTVPSWLTHPNGEFREIVTNAYLDACRISSVMTKYTLPEDPTLSKGELTSNQLFNRGRYDL